MKFPKLHIVLGVFLAAIIGGTITFSTLHSHHHISWDHPPEMADTGHCFTESNTLCPICGYLFEPTLPSGNNTETIFEKREVLTLFSDDTVKDYYSVVIKGRSPPVLG